MVPRDDIIHVDWVGRSFYYVDEDGQRVRAYFPDKLAERQDRRARGEAALGRPPATDYFKFCCAIAVAQELAAAAGNPTDWRGVSDVFLDRVIAEYKWTFGVRTRQAYWDHFQQGTGAPGVEYSFADDGSVYSHAGVRLFNDEHRYTLGLQEEAGDGLVRIQPIRFIPLDSPSERADLERFKPRVRELLDETDGVPAPTAASVLEERRTEFLSRVHPFETILRAHTVFGGRQRHLDALDRFAAGATTPYFFVTGLTGMGKTALLANWAKRLDHTKCYCAAHFISRLVNHGTEERSFLENMCVQLAAAHGVRGPLPGDMRSLRDLYVELLQRPYEADGELVIVIDGLDEALGSWEPSEELFPDNIPTGTCVVFSARSMANRDWLGELNLRLPNDSTVVLQRLTMEEVCDVVRNAQVTIKNDIQHVTDRLFQLSEGDPFYLRELLRDLEAAGGDVEGLKAHPIGLNHYLGRWWFDASELYERGWGNAFVDLMGSLAAARGPVTRDVLLALSKHDDVRGATFRRLIHAAGRYVVGDAGNGYQLSHNRVAEFAASEMSDEFGDFQDRYASLCLRWNEPGLPEQARRYALRYGVDHLREVGRVGDLIQLVDAEWLAAKQKQLGYSAMLMHDVDTVVDQCLKQDPSDEIIMALLWLGRFKQRLAHPRRPEYFDAEQALIARSGECDRAHHDVRIVGEPEDELLVLAEVFVRQWKTDQARAEHQMPAILGLAARCGADAIERAAVRVSDVAPRFGLRLCKLIPDLDESEAAGRGESPTWERCSFAIFKRLAKRDIDEALRQWDRLNIEALQVLAGVAIAGQLTRSLEAGVFPKLERVIDWLVQAESVSESHGAIATYLLWYAADLKPKWLLQAVSLIKRLHPTCGRRIGVAMLVRERYAADPDGWEVALRSMDMQELPDPVRETLTECRVAPERVESAPNPEDPAEPSNTPLSKVLSKLSAIDSAAAGLPIALDYLRELKHTDRAAAGRVTEGLLAALTQQCGTSSAAPFIDLAHHAVRCPGCARRGVTLACLDGLKSVSTNPWVVDQQLHYGLALTGALLCGGDDAERVLAGLLGELPFEEQRQRVLSAIARAAPVQGSARVAQLLRELIASDDTRGVLLPETAATALAELASRVSHDDRELAIALMRDAVMQFKRVLSADCRRNVATAMLEAALAIGPMAAWDLFESLECAPYSLRAALHRVLDTARDGCHANRDRWIRDILESPGGQAGADVPESLYKEALYRYMRLARNDRSVAFELQPARCNGLSDAWWREIPEFFDKYVQHFSDNLYQRTELYECAGIVAEERWDLFMAIVRRSPECWSTVHVLDARIIATAMLKQDTAPQALLDDLRILRERRAEAIGVSQPADSQSYRSEVLTLAAAYAPQRFAALAVDARKLAQDDVIRRLQRKRPRESWTHELMAESLDALEHSGSRVLGVALLEWISRHDTVAAPLLDRCVSAARGTNNADDLRLAAEHVASLDPSQALALFQDAVRMALNKRDYRALCDALASCRAQADANTDLAALADSWLNGPEVQSLLQPAHCLEFLHAPEVQTGHAINQCLGALSPVVTLREQSELDAWNAGLRGVADVDTEKLDEFLEQVLQRGIDAGIVQSCDVLNVVEDPCKHLSLILALADKAAPARRAAIVQTAERFIEQLPFVKDKASCFAELGDWHRQHDPEEASRFWKAALDAATKQDNESVFCAMISRMMSRCVDAASPTMALFVRAMHEACEQYAFGTPPMFMDAKPYALLACAFAMLSCEPSRFEDSLRAVEESIEGRTGRGMTGTTLVFATEGVMSSQGAEAARHFVDTVLRLSSDGLRTTIGQNALGICNYDKGPSALEEFVPAVHGFGSTRFDLARTVLPFGEDEAAAQAHLKFGVTLANSNRDSARQHIESAISLGQQGENVQYWSFWPDVWVALAAIGKREDWMRAFGELYRQQVPEKMRLDALLSCAVHSSDDPDAMIRVSRAHEQAADILG